MSKPELEHIHDTSKNSETSSPKKRMKFQDLALNLQKIILYKTTVSCYRKLSSIKLRNKRLLFLLISPDFWIEKAAHFITKYLDVPVTRIKFIFNNDLQLLKQTMLRKETTREILKRRDQESIDTMTTAYNSLAVDMISYFAIPDDVFVFRNNSDVTYTIGVGNYDIYWHIIYDVPVAKIISHSKLAHGDYCPQVLLLNNEYNRFYYMQNNNPVYHAINYIRNNDLPFVSENAKVRSFDTLYDSNLGTRDDEIVWLASKKLKPTFDAIVAATWLKTISEILYKNVFDCILKSILIIIKCSKSAIKFVDDKVVLDLSKIVAKYPAYRDANTLKNLVADIRSKPELIPVITLTVFGLLIHSNAQFFQYLELYDKAFFKEENFDDIDIQNFHKCSVRYISDRILNKIKNQIDSIGDNNEINEDSNENGEDDFNDTEDSFESENDVTDIIWTKDDQEMKRVFFLEMLLNGQLEFWYTTMLKVHNNNVEKFKSWLKGTELLNRFDFLDEVVRIVGIQFSKSSSSERLKIFDAVCIIMESTIGMSTCVRTIENKYFIECLITMYHSYTDPIITLEKFLNIRYVDTYVRYYKQYLTEDIRHHLPKFENDMSWSLST